MSDTQAYPDDYQPQTPAQRMRLYRERKRAGKVILQNVELLPNEISSLVSYGYLKREHQEDKQAVWDAFYSFLDQTLGAKQ